MAERIFQLDGAQESSSESDADGFSKSSLQGKEALRSDVSLDPGHSILEPTDGGLQLSPNWSGNITSIWSEDSACPTPSTVCQTPFWSNCSSKMDSWLSQSQESWTWNDEAGSRLADCLSGKAEAEISSTFTGELHQQSFKNITPIEPHPDLFTTTCNEEDYCSSSVVTPHRDADFALGMSQPSAVHNPSKEIDTSVWEKRMIKADNKMNETQKIIVPKAVNKKLGDEDEKPVTMSESLPSRKVLSDNNPRLTFCLTLKQYIKDCKEIVSVDFKNLCNREMVIIEYKSYNERCVQNKFLIKPLDKFLEKWNAAEKKVNKRLSKNGSRPEVVSELNICGSDERESFHSMMNVLRRKSCNTSQLNSMKNKFTVKSMEILQDNLTPGSDSMSYNVNENVVSQGKIRMKLIKSHSENFEKDLVEASNEGLVSGSGPTKMHPSLSCSNPLCSKRNKMTRLEKEDRNDRIKGLHLTDSRRQSKKSPGGAVQKKLKKWRRFSELDAKLIKEINTSFEEYFKNIVQLNNRSLKKKQKVRQSLRDDDETGEESTEDEKDVTADTEKKWTGSSIQCGALSSTTDSIKFVSRFLSKFSRMSQSMDSPPLSITISVGNAYQPAPVQLNLQPIADVSVEQARRLGKISKRKVKIESVDGAADGSSSDDSSGCDYRRRSPNQKKKRDAFYKPLNVVLQGTPAFRQPVKKRKSSTVGNAEIDEENYERKKSSASHDSEDYVGVYRENSRQSCVSSRKEKYSKGKNSSEILVTSQKSCGNEIKSPSNSVGSGQGCVGYPNVRPREPDFIFDSDQDGKSEMSMTKCVIRRSLTTKKNFRLKKIPQEDINSVTSSDEEYLNMCYKPVLKKTLSRRKSKAAMGKRYPVNQRVVSVESRVFVGGEYLEKETHDPFASAESAESSSVMKGAKNPFKASQITECVSIPSTASHQDLPATSLTPTRQQLPCTDDLNSMGSTSLRISSSGLVHADGFLSSATNDSPEPFPLSGTPLLLSESCNSQSSKSLIDSPLKLEKFDFSKTTVDFLPHIKIAGSNVETRSKEEMAVSEGISSEWIFGSSVLRPRQKPLTRKDVVESLVLCETSGSVDQAAFYGDPGDLTKAMEIGPRVLKIEGRSLSRLKPFRSTLQVLGVDERRTQLLSVPNNKSPGNRSLFSLCREIRIIPLRKPPKHERVLGWITNKERCQGISKREPKPKITVVNPLSPGAEEGSEEDMELSVTLSNSTEDGACLKVALEANSVNCLTNRREKVIEMDAPSKTEKSTGPPLLPTVRVNTEEPPGGPVHLLLSSCSQPSYEEDKRNSDNSFQIRGITLENTLGFSGPVENIQNVQLNQSRRHLSLLVMELHFQTRKDLCPDPEYDPIRGLFYAITPDGVTQDPKTGIIIVGKELSSEAASNKHEIHYVLTEKALFEKIILLVRTWDPDILAGYEIEMHSWGYLIQRGFVLEMNLLCLLGRVQSEESRSWKSAPDVPPRGDDFNDLPKNVRNMKISGRIMLDIWRVLRHEVPLTSYTFENVMYHLSHERHSLLSYRTLSFCWEHTSGRYRHITVHHYMTRILGVIRLLDQLDFINRTSELSRLFGIQFYEVLSRGSQFRVESMMLRLAKPMNYVAVSPSIVQRAQMRAPACLPLILEPESSFYTDPVIVLDFQSLYPSIIIAYNYCFSTCLGRVEKLGGREAFEFGCTQLQFSPEELKNLEHEVTISPAGVAFVKPNIRKGVLPIMLEEILETRLMVKKAMKENKDNKVLQKVLYARQLGLKLIANVTYGYTAANFSGRMPCIEVGDSVVSKGRETLHRAIQLIKNTHKWGAKVVYGDTDSVFVLTPGRSREEAFRIGSEIADAVTQDNPKPVKLKLEKVYQPSILQTKKRYVGYMYENAQQEKPVFEAKGIETVRRDGCPATGKILEKALRILFDSKDVSMVKKYTIRQFAKLFQGRINLQDLVFAKEYRGRSGYRPGACVPALYLARQWTQKDRRAEPRVKERVPYVIVNGPPGVPLIRLVRSPHDLFADRSLHINAVYYITKAFIPPMQRCFSLLGADVSSWYSEIPRKYLKSHKTAYWEGQKRITISQYFATTECIVCSKITNSPVCSDCECHQQTLGVFCLEKIRRWERCHAALLRICQGCCGRTTELHCKSIDCPVLFRRNQAFRNLEQGSALREILTQYL